MVDPLIKCFFKVYIKAWIIWVNISCDENTMGFQVHYINMNQISYNNEGDIFQYDSIEKWLNALSLLLHNKAEPKVYVDMGMS